jgi:adenylyltransferase/sulfurtransferase
MIPPADSALEITPAAAAAWLAADQGSPALADCREPDEWDICRIDGARLIPLGQFAEQAPSALDPARPVIVYCHHGVRSARAAAWLRRRGFRAWSLAGGIEAWAREVDPRVARY